MLVRSVLPLVRFSDTHCDVQRFYGNSAFAGGGLFLTSVNGDVSECAFEDNVAANSGGGLAMSQGSGDVAYSIFVNNQVRSFSAEGSLPHHRSHPSCPHDSAAARKSMLKCWDWG